MRSVTAVFCFHSSAPAFSVVYIQSLGSWLLSYLCSGFVCDTVYGGVGGYRLGVNTLELRWQGKDC